MYRLSIMMALSLHRDVIKESIHVTSGKANIEADGKTGLIMPADLPQGHWMLYK